MKPLIIYGTRPEAIKMASLIKQLPEAIVINTGQHADLTSSVRKLFDFADTYNLDIMKPGQSLQDITAAIMVKFTELVRTLKPSMVIVHGDTTTAMAAALVAYYERIPIAHVEAGLRTGKKYEPFPEEVNRVIIDSVADFAFCPTAQNATQMGKDCKTFIVGNTGIDALQLALQKITLGSPSDSEYILVTAHRRESYGEPLRNICSALEQISKHIKIIYPAHPNPNVQQAVSSLRGLPNIEIIEPLDYLEMIRYMKYAKLILTDSGGIQEEAPSLKVPVLCLRDTTERQEALEANAVSLVGTDCSRIVTETLSLLSDEQKYKSMQVSANPYGDGTAAEQIANILRNEGFVGGDK